MLFLLVLCGTYMGNKKRQACTKCIPYLAVAEYQKREMKAKLNAKQFELDLLQNKCKCVQNINFNAVVYSLTVTCNL